MNRRIQEVVQDFNAENLRRLEDMARNRVDWLERDDITEAEISAQCTLLDLANACARLIQLQERT